MPLGTRAGVGRTEGGLTAEGLAGLLGLWFYFFCSSLSCISPVSAVVPHTLFPVLRLPLAPTGPSPLPASWVCILLEPSREAELCGSASPCASPFPTQAPSVYDAGAL